MTHCKSYIGVACIGANCPMALRDEYTENGYDTVKSCDDCWKYKGCEDCALDGTEECTKEEITND